MNFLFTREARYLDALPHTLLNLGVRLHHFPMLSIEPVLNQEDCDSIASTLTANTVCAFVSRTAIRYMGHSLLQHCPDWPNLPCVVLGPGSCADLSLMGVPNQQLIAPTSPPYDTETLLQHPFFKDIKQIHNRDFVFFRGQTGRTLLVDWLRQQGVGVREIELYHRAAPKLPSEQCHHWYDVLSATDITLISSSDSLYNLCQIVSNIVEKVGFGFDLLSKLKKQKLLVPSYRLDQLAKSLGFIYITQIDGLRNTTIINTVKQLMASQ